MVKRLVLAFSARIGYSLRPSRIPTSVAASQNVLGMWAFLGGTWDNAARAGLFCQNLANPASNANTSIGCRLAIRAWGEGLTSAVIGAKRLVLAFSART